MNSAIILAAGVGTRFKSAIPKIFHTVGGLSLLDHVIHSALSAGLEDITVVLRPGYEAFPLKFADAVSFAYQSTVKGSSDAVKCALKSQNNLSVEVNCEKEPFCNNFEWIYILYGDIPLVTPETLQALSEVAKICEKTAVVVLAMNSAHAKELGKLEPAAVAGTIKGIIEAKDASAFVETIPLCNAGLLVRKDLLYKLISEIKPSPVTGEFYITEIVRLAYEAGYVCRYYEADAAELSGVNSRQELAVIEQYFQNRMRKKHMDNGVTLVAPETVFFSFDTTIENDVIIDPFVTFGPNVHLKSGTHINSFCVVEGADIKNAAVGPFARIRPNTQISENAKIGNFVEIKNSLVQKNAKINHLSYVGDSEIGKNTNIGAGTITCNYDGFQKHKICIGENVFIGSNSALVAPVEIGDNAMIGAGSVITQKVEPGFLAISRTPQRNIENGSIEFRELKSKKSRQ
ncbi:MAG: bifunctional UDP-N-acetylglucosamine diphosphorylase/glucosamine-1-phosphate N-acetyltransferase GlmU [Holosporaceae bacterium]|jgi:bifunctional UDP-N-acetylglucosamine pyrophosphorylase/glucosamine-1-phosphate N-acetyltransferase|nr:bifunctional UDP-N-acetylglucosamine diphosphorylase/glucosamine-1-phosphate N-acetyltransferase GlmU [Holosporaceae bacterium]